MMSGSICTNCLGDHEETLFEALKNIVWYDGHYVWLKELRDDLEKFSDNTRFYSCPIDTNLWHTEKHTIWMLLVGVFGDWGTSIRSGWIEKVPECIEFIDALCKDAWEEEYWEE